MGQAASSGGGEMARFSLRRRKSGRKRPSHAFSLNGNARSLELIDLNAASEELLMTLPGVDRPTARAIVDHRRAIGRYRKVEDVALAPGMGAERLRAIRQDVCVHGGETLRLTLPVDVNRATVFQLQCLRGLDQRLAAKVVEHRRRRGPFKSLDELASVKGLDRHAVSLLRSQLIIGDPLSYPINGVKSAPNGVITTPPPSERRNVFDDVFELLSVCSTRPLVPAAAFRRHRNDRRAVRIGTWNLHEFGVDKASNPGVREVVCRTILENGLSILGVQDVADEGALKIICDDLNMPSLKRVIEWKDNSKKWNYRFIKGYTSGKNIGFVYETLNSDFFIHAKIDSDSIFHTADDATFSCCCIDFSINDCNISILNVQFLQTNLDYSKTLLCDKIDKLIALDKKIIVIGDFYSSEHVKDLAMCYESVIKADADTLVEFNGKKLKEDGGAAILIANDDDANYTGYSRVIHAGLNHLAIPCGWSWGGPVSPYCPAWAEFYVD